MTSLLIAIVCFGLAMAICARVLTRQRGAGRHWPVSARALLTPPEQVLYRRLKAAFPDHVVLAQVALSQSRF